jgi:hypothetical protein
MSNANDFGPIIALLETRYIEAQKIADEKLAALNAVRQEAGLPARQSGIEAGANETGTVLTQIKRDTFYGKKQMTAVREYLEMRRGQGDGPATPREILDALKAGGYPFEAKSDDIALVGLRALLRKANNVFHKLPGTGAYGLLSWYPNAKPSRDDTENDDDDSSRRSRSASKKKAVITAAPKKRGRPPKVPAIEHKKESAAADDKE